MWKRMLALGAAGLALSGILASGAGALSTPTTHAFLCYSKYEVDPGVWSLTRSAPTIHETAADLLALGYWSPYAETSMPTKTLIGGGYYLICNLPAGMSPVGNVMITRKGASVGATKVAGHPGYYPLAA